MCDDPNFLIEVPTVSLHFRLLNDSDINIKKQAIIMIRNAATTEASAAYILEFMGEEKALTILGELADVNDEDTAAQVGCYLEMLTMTILTLALTKAMCALDNTARVAEPQIILEHPTLLTMILRRLHMRCVVAFSAQDSS